MHVFSEKKGVMHVEILILEIIQPAAVGWNRFTRKPFLVKNGLADLID